MNKPFNKNSFFHYYLKKTGGLNDPRYVKEMMKLLKEWLPDEKMVSFGEGYEYELGWNDYRDKILDELE